MNRLNSVLLLFFILPCISSCGLFSLLNSGTVQMKYTVSRASIEGRLYEEKARVGDVSFSVRNVQHPLAYGRWNTNMRLSPSLHADNITYQTGELQEDGNFYPNVNIKRLLSFGNLKLYNHTPVGAFVLTGGYGGTLYKMDDGAELDTIRTKEVWRLDLSYIAFISRRFFLQMGPRYYNEEGYKQYIFSFRLGYYWGSIRR